MTYTCDESLTHFEFWSGARDRAATLTYDQLDRLDDLLPDAMGWDDTDSIPSGTEINDLFWFEEDFIAELLGFDDWEALERHNAGEDEEDETDDDTDDEEESGDEDET